MQKSTPVKDRHHKTVNRNSRMICCSCSCIIFVYRVSVPCLSLWERWPSAARTERVLPLPLGEVAERSEDGEGKQKGCKPLSVTCGDSSPKGRAKGLWHIGMRNGAYLYRYAPFTVLRLPVKCRRAFSYMLWFTRPDFRSARPGRPRPPSRRCRRRSASRSCPS